MKAARRLRSGTTTRLRAGPRPRAAEATDAFTLGLRRRLRKVLSMLSAVRDGEDPDAVHDLRVWSRRLQQGLDAAFPKPRPRRVKKARRHLRGLRRALGEWRNLDVSLELVLERRRRTRDRALRRAWTLVTNELHRLRRQEIERARCRLSRVRSESLGKLLTRLIDEAQGRRPARIRDAVGEALDAWQSALATARASRQPELLHALRIATKRLRYRVELSRDLGDPAPDRAFRWMKDLQGRLGRWHDRQVLRARVAGALARPAVLLEEPAALRAALANIETGADAENGEIDGILRRASDRIIPETLRSWIGS